MHFKLLVIKNLITKLETKKNIITICFYFFKFCIPMAEDVHELRKFLLKEFFTSEPCSRNMSERGGRLSQKIARSFVSYNTGKAML